MPTQRLTVCGEERARRAEARLGQQVLGKWRLERLIGMGGMAAVFEATHANGNRAAIKILHADLASFDDTRERFLAEGYAANRVAHAGVVAVRDEGTTEDGAVFLVMDLLRGQTLAERLDSSGRPLSVRQALDIGLQLLDVLVHAHRRGIVHRDIKPENVYLTREGRVRLLDFGVAQVRAASRAHRTELGTAMGTPAFMSPEQALGSSEELDGRSDLWSLGATLYLMLSGVPAREAGSPTEQLLWAMTRRVPSLGEVASLPRAVVAVVDRALAFDRDRRFPDAESMQLALRAIVDELSEAELRAPPPSIEPVALSLRPPRADADHQRPSIPTMRPVAASTAPASPSRRPSAPSALPVYVACGFALGLALVFAARLTTAPHQPLHAATAAAAVSVAGPPSREAASVKEPLQAPSAAVSSGAASASSATPAGSAPRRVPGGSLKSL